MNREGMYNKIVQIDLILKQLEIITAFIKVLTLNTTLVVKPVFKSKFSAFDFTDILYFVFVLVFGRYDLCNHI